MEVVAGQKERFPYTIRLIYELAIIPNLALYTGSS